MKRIIHASTAVRGLTRRLLATLILTCVPTVALATTSSPPPDTARDANPVAASIWTVTSAGEASAIGSLACDAGTRRCPTLRDAINQALDGDTIVFDDLLDRATIPLTLFSNPMGCVTSSAITCSDSGTLGRQFGPSAFFVDGRHLTIDATALAHGVTIARSDATGTKDFRLFDIAPEGGLTLKGLVLRNGVAQGGGGGLGGGALGAGGAVFNRGEFSAERCSFVGHRASGGSAGWASDGGDGGGGVGGPSDQYGRGGGPNRGFGFGFGLNGGFGGFGGGGGSGSGFGGTGGGGGFGGGGGSSGNGGFGGAGGFGGGGGAGAGGGTGGGAGFGGGFGGGGVSSGGGGGGGMGGALFNDAGTMRLSQVTLHANSAAGGVNHHGGGGGGSAYGGAVFNYNGVLSLSFVTGADNTVSAGGSNGGTPGTAAGAAIYSLGDGHCNTTGEHPSGGNLCAGTTATLAMTMSVAARGAGSANDVTVDRINGGHSSASGTANFIGAAQALNGASINGLVRVNAAGVTDPKLASQLAANDGFGLTLMPLPGSPLIDPTAAGVSCGSESIDQRGVARPQGTACDIGAVEVATAHYPLTVTVQGPGQVDALGVQPATASPISACTSAGGAHCAASFRAGHPIRLTATPSQPNGYHVTWSGACTAVNGTPLRATAVLSGAATCSALIAPNTVGGHVHGLIGSGLTLHLDPGDGGSGEDLALNGGASTFAFATPVAAGATYTVSLATQPTQPSQTCTLSGETGTMPDGAVSDVVVTCTTHTYTIGGNASGEVAGLVLQLNGANDLPIGAVGPFAFATPIASGAAYAVSILASPPGQTCTVTQGSGSVVDADIANVAVSCAPTPRAELALTIAPGRSYARYGQVVDYLPSLVNSGNATAENVTVTFAPSPGFDHAHAHLACFGGDAGAACVQDSADPLRFNVTLPAGRTLIWLIDIPVWSTASDPEVAFAAAATGATPVSDRKTLVIYREGFDVPYGDGTHSVPVLEGAAARAILDGEALHDITVPSTLSEVATPLLLVRDGERALRVDVQTVAGVAVVRLVERDAQGHERATSWQRTPVGAALTLASAPADTAGENETRAVVLLGPGVTAVLEPAQQGSEPETSKGN